LGSYIPILAPDPANFKTLAAHNLLLRLPAVGDNGAMEAEPTKVEPPKRKRRWFRYGEPWGLFERTNPRATWPSLARRALAGAVLGPTAYGAVIFFRRDPTEYLAIKLILSSVLCAFVAGVYEWQVDVDDL
jgi:hypothetical protein